MDAFEKWWHGIPEEDRGEYSDMRLAFEAGLRLAADIAEQHASVEGIAQRIRDAILKEAGE